MKHTTAAVIILAIFGVVTAFTIYITHSGWWLTVFGTIITFMVIFLEDDTNDKV